MSADKYLKKGTAVFGLLLTACTSGVSANSTAAVASANTVAAITDRPTADVAAGNFDDGYQLGLRNGGILADRLKKRTTEIYGCSAIEELQSALVKVARAARPPSRNSDEYVAGFYTGYLDSIRGALAEVRNTCDESQYSSGDFAGQLYGAVACQVATVSVSAVSLLQVQPLYTGWSGGSDAVQASCRTTLLATLQSCTDGTELAASINATVSVSCSDSQSLF